MFQRISAPQQAAALSSGTIFVDSRDVIRMRGSINEEVPPVPHSDKTECAPWRETGVTMESAKKDEPVVYEKEVIVPLDPAHEEKPTLVERERIEKEQAKKEENRPTIQEKEAVCALSGEEDNEPAEEGEHGGQDEEQEREEIKK